MDGGRDRRLDERARVLGSRAYALICRPAATPVPAFPRSPKSWGCATGRCRRHWRGQGVRVAARPQRLAAQRRSYTEERIAARVAQLGFADVGAYLVDRVMQQGWLLAEVSAELGAHRLTVRRLLDHSGIRRVRRTARERAAADRGRRVQAVGWQARRAARLAELGFQDLAGYLKARHVEQGWSVKRMRAELGVGRCWLVGELARLGLRP